MINNFIEYKNYDINTLICTDIKYKKKIAYINYPFSFDIEVTSFYDKVIDSKGKSLSEKRACMYIWQASINGTFIYGRTWEEFKELLEKIKNKLDLNYYKRAVFYVHNLAYEFQFLRGIFNISEVFARNERHPMKFLLDECFEFKCSLLLSGLSLAKTAENLTSIKLQKMVGDLDYELKRNSLTTLSDKELGYCKEDVEILHYFILEEMKKNNNDITKIPLTKTGYVRRYCYDYINNHTNIKYYRDKIKKIAPTSEELYCLLYKAFAGGDTHANYLHVFDKVFNVHSFDLTSSYPTQQIRHKFPMQPFRRKKIEDMKMFRNEINTHACVFEIIIWGITDKTCYHTLSKSKCPDSKNIVVDNGRIVSADYVTTFMTDIDFKDFEKFYNYDRIYVAKFYYTEYGYLPKQYVESILNLYEQKTTLKGVAGKEQEYLVSKGMLNSIFGMSVTNPVNDEITYENGEWGTQPKEIKEALYNTYINNENTICVFQWGVWCTAWARHELRQAILELGEDLIYCDTDSCKFLNLEKHKKFFDKYNKEIIKEIDDVLIFHEINPNRARPKNNKGEICQLGVWDYEGYYDEFKTLGAKRYAFRKDKENKTKKKNEPEYNITVSGIRKDSAVPYMIEKSKEKNIDFFDFFTNDMVIPAEYSGRTTFTYIDKKPYSCKLTDYQGNTEIVNEKTYVHSEKVETTITLADEFLKFVYFGGFESNFGSTANKSGKYNKKLCTTPWLMKSD